jgi:uncharacterized membrane protein (DUF441 family)
MFDGLSSLFFFILPIIYGIGCIVVSVTVYYILKQINLKRKQFYITNQKQEISFEIIILLFCTSYIIGGICLLFI